MLLIPVFLHLQSEVRKIIKITRQNNVKALRNRNICMSKLLDRWYRYKVVGTSQIYPSALHLHIFVDIQPWNVFLYLTRTQWQKTEIQNTEADSKMWHEASSTDWQTGWMSTNTKWQRERLKYTTADELMNTGVRSEEGGAKTQNRKWKSEHNTKKNKQNLNWQLKKLKFLTVQSYEKLDSLTLWYSNGFSIYLPLFKPESHWRLVVTYDDVK